MVNFTLDIELAATSIGSVVVVSLLISLMKLNERVERRGVVRLSTSSEFTVVLCKSAMLSAVVDSTSAKVMTDDVTIICVTSGLSLAVVGGFKVRALVLIIFVVVSSSGR